jgi:hypothetical protein
MDQELLYFFVVVVIFVAGYSVGVWRTVSKIVDLVHEQVEEEVQSLTPCVLNIEKIGNKFYAYAGSEFISQGTEFKPLILGILNHAHDKSLKFTNTVVSSLSETEVALLLQTLMSLSNQDLANAH